MWLINSSIGRKVVMSVTGIALILFLTFHGCMNIVALFSGEAYNWICEALGANWYAVVATLGLAALAVIHIVYAFILTAQNRSARGSERYAETEKPAKVEWASQNMLVLGIIVVCFMVVHLIQFWAKMQLPEVLGQSVEEGTHYLDAAFACPVTLVIYLIGFAALWFHMTHGFWSAFQSLGANNKTWLPRLQCISSAWATVVCVLFAVEAIVFAVRAMTGGTCTFCF